MGYERNLAGRQSAAGACLPFCLPDKTLACNTAHILNARVQAVPFLPGFSYVESDLSPQTGLCIFLTSHGIRSVGERRQRYALSLRRVAEAEQ